MVHSFPKTVKGLSHGMRLPRVGPKANFIYALVVPPTVYVSDGAYFINRSNPIPVIPTLTARAG